MSHSTENELDTFLPVGETFVLIVGAICAQVLIGAGRMREDHPTGLASRWEEEARNRVD
jgi:hypothetical protein